MRLLERKAYNLGLVCFTKQLDDTERKCPVVDAIDEPLHHTVLPQELLPRRISVRPHTSLRHEDTQSVRVIRVSGGKVFAVWVTDGRHGRLYTQSRRLIRRLAVFRRVTAVQHHSRLQPLQPLPDTRDDVFPALLVEVPGCARGAARLPHRGRRA